MSDSGRSNRIRALFDEVVDLDPERRAARLAEVCGADEELRREVESLLEAEDARGPGVRRKLEGLQLLNEAGEEGSAPAGPDEIPVALRAALEDRYSIERVLGRGGMATVYLADDLRHERRVAIKVLRPELAAAIGNERFVREIKLTAGLAHPHILPLHDSGDAGGFLYYVMPYIEGESLRDRLKREERLPVDDALRITREVADALGSAHARGIVHRDIKPENILLEEGHAVVADFGIARVVDAAGGARFAETTGIVLGTPRYMSPEQVGGDRDLDGRSDLYSLGCVLYEMLAGEPPVSDRSVHRLLSRKLLGEFPSVGEVRPEIPSEIEYTVTRALATEPEERFGTAGELVAALDPLASHARPGAPASVWSRVLTRTAMGLGAAVVIAGAAYLLLGRPSPADAAGPSIGVLPFEIIGPDPDETVGYFVAGLRLDVATALGKVSALRVSPLTKVDSVYGDGGRGLGETASELRVSFLLHARVEVRDNRFRVRAQLYDVEGDSAVLYQLDGDYATNSEIFDKQTEIAEQIASAVGAEPTAEELALIERRPKTDNRQALALYTAARVEESLSTPESLRLAADLYERATQADPEFGEAYAGVATAYSLLHQVDRWTPEEYASRSTAAAERALAVDSALAEPYRILAEVKWLSTWDFFGAEQDFERALSLNPQAPYVHIIYAQFLNFVAGKHEEALDHSLRAQDLAPTDPFITANVGWRYSILGRYDEALAEYDRALEIDPNHWVAFWARGWTYWRLGRYDEAIAALELANELEGEGLDVLPALGTAYAQAGRRADAEGVLDQLIEIDMDSTEYVPPSSLAFLYAGLGQKELAFQWLERAYQERDQMLTFWFIDSPLADSLGSDPRFEAIRDSIGLSEYAAARSQG